MSAKKEFDLEKSLAFHYTKTREQNLALLEMYAHDAEKSERPAGSIREILRAMRAG